MLTNDIDKGCIVVSSAGRDKGKYFFVLDLIGEDYALIVDGKFRCIEKPKKKKIKHIKFYAENNNKKILEKIINGIKLENAEIKKALNQFLTEEVL
jgi:ribosomal protein L14E/L6E/L27E